MVSEARAGWQTLTLTLTLALNPTLILTLTRPYCRKLAFELSEMRSEFEAAGARLTIVAGTDVGAPEFMEQVWQGGELLVDDEEKVSEARAGWPTLTLTPTLALTRIPTLTLTLTLPR